MDQRAAEKFVLGKLKADLPKERTYHCFEHTRDVYDAAVAIAQHEGINGEDLDLLRTAALFHDSGFILQNLDHEEASCTIVRESLPRFGYNKAQVEYICAMIMATKIPQSPRDKLSRILCDADLDYLGRPDFFHIGGSLFEELKSYGVLSTEREWNELQLRFIEKHRYFTPTNKRTREPVKQVHLEQVRKRLEIAR